MDNWLINYESIIRLSFFFSIFVIMAILETLLPRLQQANNLSGSMRIHRWINNFSLIFLSSALIKIILPMSLVAFSFYCQQSSWGLFNQDFLAHLGHETIFITSLIIFDFVIYWQHRVFHKIPLLWRLHKVHHSDQAFDVTTGIRFHPLEIVLSIAIKFFIVLIFGLPASSIIAFEVILNALALFNHSNVNIPEYIDRHIRKLIVTPDMHRVHHSQIPSETNSNFGFNISLWDRLFSSYIEQPALGQKNIQIGVKEFSNPDSAFTLIYLLKMPFNAAKKDRKRRNK